MPCVEIGPAARDVCKVGFSFAPATTSDQSVGVHVVSVSVVGSKRHHHHEEEEEEVGHQQQHHHHHHKSSHKSSANNTSNNNNNSNSKIKENVSFGNDTSTKAFKRARAAAHLASLQQQQQQDGNNNTGTGANTVTVPAVLVDKVNSTGKTKVEQEQLRATLRQGVDRFVALMCSKYH